MFYMGPLDLSNLSVEMGSTAESFVVSSGEAVTLTGDTADERFQGTLLEEYGLPVRSMICVPLNDLKQVVGCLQLANKTNGTPFNDDELRICGQLASLAALTIDEKGLEVNAGEKKDVLISLRGITKEFPNGDTVNRVLRGIDLDIYRGGVSGRAGRVRLRQIHHGQHHRRHGLPHFGAAHGGREGLLPPHR